MAYRDLKDFIDTLEHKGLLKRIRAETDPKLEIAEIADRVVKAGGPALLFERVKGATFPLLVNAFGSRERMCLALGVKDLDDIGREIAGMLDAAALAGPFGRLRAAPRLARLSACLPKKLLGAGACQEVIERSPDISSLPALQCWPGDGGKFLTLPLVCTRDPDTGTQNVGMYRMQLYDGATLGMHWHPNKDGSALYRKYRERGGRMPVSVALGGDPAVIYAATAPLPPGVDELLLAGFIRKAPVTVVKSVTNDILVPAESEFVLEGYVDTSEPFRPEGPFGDHTGCYSPVEDYPAFHLTCLTRRKDAIFLATVTGRPPMEDCWFGKATERIFLPLLRLACPEIEDICFPLEGVFHNCVILSVRKRYPGAAAKAMHAVWGMGQMACTKLIVAVDGDVDPSDYSAVAWKVFNNIDASRDIVISRGPLDALDHASPTRQYGARMGIDATRKLPEEGGRPWPDEVAMSPEIKALVDGRWAEYGI